MLFRSHCVIGRLVCKLWRDCLPPPPPRFLFSFGPTVAAHGSISLLQWAKEKMIPSYAWDGRMCCEVAIRGGHLELLKWLKDEDGWNHPKAPACAAEGGHLEVLKWLRENGCPWRASTCTSAAKGGHFEMLKWLKENGCPLDQTTFDEAAGSGNLEMLKWLKERVCGSSTLAFDKAATGGHLDALKWLKENEFPCTASLFFGSFLWTLGSAEVVESQRFSLARS